MKRAKSLESRHAEALSQKEAPLLNRERREELLISPLVHHSPELVSLEDLSISYYSKTVLSGVSFKIKNGDRVLIEGPNGSGKSSLIKLITGEEIAFEGTLRLASILKISYVPQNVSALSGTIADFAKNAELGEVIFYGTLYKLGFEREEFEKNMSALSDGQKKKVLIAKSLCERAHLYVWDEPLNCVDLLSRIQLEDMILDFAPTMLFVEHDSAFCSKIATGKVIL